jgi:hypothetical protein
VHVAHGFCILGVIFSNFNAGNEKEKKELREYNEYLIARADNHYFVKNKLVGG